LKEIQKELEICCKTLNQYLEKKRRVFPRFYYLSNNSLLALLSSTAMDCKIYLSTLFSSLNDFKAEEIVNEDEMIAYYQQRNQTRRRSSTISGRRNRRVSMANLIGQSAMNLLNQSFNDSLLSNSNTNQSDIDSAQLLAQQIQQQQQQQQTNHNQQFEITEVYSTDGEILELNKRVLIEKTTPENWLTKLKDSVGDTIRRALNNSLNDLTNGLQLTVYFRI
jgi:dynein heavy chain